MRALAAIPTFLALLAGPLAAHAAEGPAHHLDNQAFLEKWMRVVQELGGHELLDGGELVLVNQRKTRSDGAMP